MNVIPASERPWIATDTPSPKRNAAAGRIRGKALATVERHLDDGADLPTALAVLRAMPPPELDRLDFAEESLANSYAA